LLNWNPNILFISLIVMFFVLHYIHKLLVIVSQVKYRFLEKAKGFFHL